MLETTNLNKLGKSIEFDSEIVHVGTKLDEYEISGREFEEDIIIENIFPEGKNDTLIFRDCYFHDIQLKKINCTAITFINCVVSGAIRTYSGTFQRLNLRDCSVHDILIEEAVSILTINLTNAKVDHKFVIRHTQVQQLELGTGTSFCMKLIFEKSSSVETLRIQCQVEYLRISRLPTIKLSDSGVISRIDVNHITERELMEMESEIIKSGSHRKQENLRYFLTLLLSMYEQFESKKMFTESDICLYMIRRVNIQIKKTGWTKNKFYRFFRNFYLNCKQFLLEYCFGWGIKIINNVITMISVILLFAVSYGISSAGGYGSGVGTLECFEISVNRFFLGSVYDDPYQFFRYFDSLESLIGVVMITVFTGVLVRKIIR